MATKVDSVLDLQIMTMVRDGRQVSQIAKDLNLYPAIVHAARTRALNQWRDENRFNRKEQAEINHLRLECLWAAVIEKLRDEKDPKTFADLCRTALAVLEKQNKQWGLNVEGSMDASWLSKGLASIKDVEELVRKSNVPRPVRFGAATDSAPEVT